jgi:hypothetical protein
MVVSATALTTIHPIYHVAVHASSHQIRARGGLHFMSDDHLETHHRNGNHNDNTFANLALLHGHCHDEVHRTKCS